MKDLTNQNIKHTKEILLVCILAFTVISPSRADVERKDLRVIRPNLEWSLETTTGINRAVYSVLEKPGSTVSKSSEKVPLVNGRVDGEVTFESVLPNDFRSNMNVVHFGLLATAHPEAEAGTVLNIDGAVVGLVGGKDSTKGGGIAQLVARVGIDKNGKAIWRPLGVLLQQSPVESFYATPLLAVKVDNVTRTWSLYMHDNLVRSNIPLAPQEGAPTIKIRAGTRADSARLLSLAISNAPPLSPDGVVRSNGNKINLKDEYEKGNPTVKRFHSTITGHDKPIKIPGY
jgi:hypothetical protein